MTPSEFIAKWDGHAIDSDVVEAYQRSDRFKKRRTLMEN